MQKEQILIGSVTAVLCLLGLWNSRWLLVETRKGQRLIHWIGEGQALRVLRGFLIAGVALGALLAFNVIKPIRW